MLIHWRHLCFFVFFIESSFLGILWHRKAYLLNFFWCYVYQILVIKKFQRWKHKNIICLRHVCLLYGPLLPLAQVSPIQVTLSPLLGEKQCIDNLSVRIYYRGKRDAHKWLTWFIAHMSCCAVWVGYSVPHRCPSALFSFPYMLCIIQKSLARFLRPRCWF